MWQWKSHSCEYDLWNFCCSVDVCGLTKRCIPHLSVRQRQFHSFFYKFYIFNGEKKNHWESMNEWMNLKPLLHMIADHPFFVLSRGKKRNWNSISLSLSLVKERKCQVSFLDWLIFVFRVEGIISRFRGHVCCALELIHIKKKVHQHLEDSEQNIFLCLFFSI